MTRPAPRDALRLAVTPRWLAAAGIVVLLAVAAALLGRWQWDRTQDILAAERAALSQAIPVEQAVDPQGSVTLPPESIGRPVLLAGEYVPDLQVAVTNREHEGQPGVWIVTGLRLADGRLAAVLRGWLPDAEAPGAAAPMGDVMVTGVLQPDETFYADAEVPVGTVASIAHDRLAALWGDVVLPGFVVLESQEPALPPSPVPVMPTVQTSDVPFPLQNFVYAFQWWLFALFGVVVYLRWLWLETRRSHDPAGDAPAGEVQASTPIR